MVEIKKKQNIFAVTISDKAVQILHRLGYIDKRQKNKRKKNLSGFFNEILIDWTERKKLLNLKEIEYDTEYDILKRLQDELFKMNKRIVGQANIVKKLSEEIDGGNK